MNIMENKAVKMCPHCYVPMEEKVANYPMGSALLSVDRFHVDIYCCPQCKLVKLFAAGHHASEEREVRHLRPEHRLRRKPQQLIDNSLNVKGARES